jgi:hypothetical protein
MMTEPRRITKPERVYEYMLTGEWAYADFTQWLGEFVEASQDKAYHAGLQCGIEVEKERVSQAKNQLI